MYTYIHTHARVRINFSNVCPHRQLASIQTSFTSADTALGNAQSSVNAQSGCSGDAQCVAINQTLASMRANLQLLNVRIGVDTDNDGSYETGMLRQISCSVVNGMCVCVCVVCVRAYVRACVRACVDVVGFSFLL